jgi:hypothetical protein
MTVDDRVFLVDADRWPPAHAGIHGRWGGYVALFVDALRHSDDSGRAGDRLGPGLLAVAGMAPNRRLRPSSDLVADDQAIDSPLESNRLA